MRGGGGRGGGEEEKMAREERGRKEGRMGERKEARS